ncbi:MAG: redox-sensitive bicupin YhaK (pirin superfamily) [Cognaticolwellia sp.]|jgi:redox-sensitive bicupin YhaK (pirin superfamily)
MSAGTGIVHSKYNRTNKLLTFYQIWLDSSKDNVTPRWESKKLPSAYGSALTLLVSGYPADKNKASFINQKNLIYGRELAKGTVIEHKVSHQAYILASDGMFKIEDNLKTVTINKGDGLEVT